MTEKKPAPKRRPWWDLRLLPEPPKKPKPKRPWWDLQLWPGEGKK